METKKDHWFSKSKDDSAGKYIIKLIHLINQINCSMCLNILLKLNVKLCSAVCSISCKIYLFFSSKIRQTHKVQYRILFKIFN